MFLVVILIITSCAYTRKTPTLPNISIIDPTYKTIDPAQIATLNKVQNLLNTLSTCNPTLAHELGKLPDLHDGISNEEIGAIRVLIDLYKMGASNFDKVFEQMYKIGLPDVRKYCSPLQAFFWMAYDSDIEEIKKQLNVCLTELPIDRDWPFLESYETEYLLPNDWHFSDQKKWSDPKSIIDRLNSPELLEYWLMQNFKYDWDRFNPRRAHNAPQSAEKTIRRKKGVCHDAAYLAYVCLKRAGYDVTTLNVWYSKQATRGGGGHAVCVIKMKQIDEDVYYIVGDTNAPGFIVGPIESIKAAAKRIAKIYGVKRYVTGMFGW